MEKPLKSTIERGQRGTIALLAVSILFLISAAVDKDSSYGIYYIYLMTASFVAAAIWNIIFLRCPSCKKYVGEYMLIGPPIKVSKNCEHCGYLLKETE